MLSEVIARKRLNEWWRDRIDHFSVQALASILLSPPPKLWYVCDNLQNTVYLRFKSMQIYGLMRCCMRQNNIWVKSANLNAIKSLWACTNLPCKDVKSYGSALELRMLHAFAELRWITLSFHTDKECDTSVVLLVYGPCMVGVVSGMVTSSSSAMILWANAKVHDPVGEGSCATACSQA